MGETKTCSTCKVEKPLATGFHKDSTKKHGYSYQCKVCKEDRKRITKKTPHGGFMEKQKRNRSNTARMIRKRDYVRTLKESNPCTDCGRYEPYYCMDYDHISNIKNFEIGSAVNNKFISFDRLVAEIAICELVCAVCHRKRTHNQGYRRNTKTPDA